MSLLQDIVEAFDSEINIDWHESHGAHVGGFEVNSVKYILQLSPIVIQDLKVFEASFLLFDAQNDRGFATSGATSTAPTAVYGIVANALIKKIPMVRCDAVFFSAEPRHSKDEDQHQSKLRIYKFAAQRISKKLGWELYLNANEFLLTREYHGKSIKSFKHWQEELREALEGSPFTALNKGHDD